MPQAPDRLRRAYRLILGLAGTCIGLSAVLIYLALQRGGGSPSAATLEDPELRRQVVARLIEDNPGLFDSHSDADVGRVYLPDLRGQELGGVTVSTNRFGMRERDYALPKPDGMVRVVLLGDSMVFGLGVAAENRLGAYLERWLTERVPDFTGRVECLHLGAASWNIRAETAYLRRQLSDLQPDLVIHVIVPNDIEDSVGVRGFGAMAGFSTQRRQRADVRITAGFPSQVLGLGTTGVLRLGLDHEPRARYRTAGLDLRHLARAVEDAGGEYRLLIAYRTLLPVAWQHLARHLAPEHVVYLSSRATGPPYTLARGDPHWNPQGHALIARLLYGLITRDDLLPRLRPPAWDRAAEALEEIAGAGRREAERELTAEQVLAIYGSPTIASSLHTGTFSSPLARQIHGGLDRQGRVSPYASLMLRNDGGRRLRITAAALRRPELDGTRVRVFVDADPVGEFALEAGRQLTLAYPLPAATAERPYLSVRFQADDYVYKGRGRQHCVAFSLQRVAIESDA